MAEDVSTRPKTKTGSETGNEPIISDGYIIDCIPGEKPLKEQVRQFIAQALKNQYRIKYDVM